MPLEFTDHRHHFADENLSEDAQREQFAIYSDLLECIARFFHYNDGTACGLLGKLSQNDSNILGKSVELNIALADQFSINADPTGAESEKG